LLENRSREKEEAIGSRLIINIIASSCNAGIKITEGTGLLYEESPKIRRVQVSEEIANLLLYKDRPDVIPRCIRVYGIENRNLYSRKIIFAGSFDPCHKNHIEMARIAAKKYGTSVDFEISIINVDKPPIDYISLEDRITSIKDFHDPDFMGNIFVTNTPLFAEKANIFPNSTFIIGADTMNRLFDPRYYRPHENKYSLLEHFRERHVDFLVFNRKGNEIKVSPEVKSLITIVPDDEYIDDGISSSLIRKMQLNK
jgi:nicotinic acid mononucleotide adenylyltransferase